MQEAALHRTKARSTRLADFGQYVLAGIAAALGAAALGWVLAYHHGVENLDRQLEDKFSFSANVLSAEIERLRYLPRVLGEDPRLQAALLNPANIDTIEQANHHLQRLRTLTEADETYLIDLSGVTLAASNWDEEGSYVGANYAFRPYFIDGLAQAEALYYAIGVTTGKRGAFLSARLDHHGQAIGLSVVKMDLSSLESTWARAGEITLVADQQGVSFLSSNPQWRFRTLAPLSAQTQQLLAQEQRYADVDLTTIAALPISGRYFYPEKGGTYRIMQAFVPKSNWQMMVALPLAPVTAMASLVAAFTATAGAMATLGFLAFNQRRQILRLRLIEADRLERAVRQRTSELANEVEQRSRAQNELLRAQEGLVHAAKLAVLGRISTAIVHEIGQSLSALDNNLAAAELHNQKSDHKRLETSLERARKMLRRLQGVVVRLRSFGARQNLVPLANVEIKPILLTALEIIAPRAKELAVEITLPQCPYPKVHADGPRLEQIVTNVLLNAVEACANITQKPKIEIDIQNHGERVAITFTDNGQGFSKDALETLGQAFETDKKDGLGLGLYIVQNLLEQIHGQIEFAQNPRMGGAQVRILLLPAQESQ